MYCEFLYAAVAFACRECTTDDSVLVVPHTVLSLALIVSKLGVFFRASRHRLMIRFDFCASVNKL